MHGTKTKPKGSIHLPPRTIAYSLRAKDQLHHESWHVRSLFLSMCNVSMPGTVGLTPWSEPPFNHLPQFCSRTILWSKEARQGPPSTYRYCCPLVARCYKTMPPVLAYTMTGLEPRTITLAIWRSA
jgi:hypothetical protein